MQNKDSPFRDSAIAEDLGLFISHPAFPCVGAKSVRSLGTLRTFEAGEFGCAHNTLPVYEQLSCFDKLLQKDNSPLRSFVCVFEHATPFSEYEFERVLWRHLSWLHAEDAHRGISWAKGSSSNPRSEAFGMSIAGHSYFIVGLHPNASRTARRFGRPAIVFNSQAQFSGLRADGRYSAMQSIIRARDTALEGSINPMLGEHGQALQAPQYSGRRVGADWKCPFSAVVVND